MRFYGDMSEIGSILGRKLGSAAFDYDKLYDNAYKHEASAAKDIAAAQYRNAQARQLQDRMQYQNPEFASKLAGIMSGLAGDQSETMRNYLDTGAWGETPNYSDAGPVQPQTITSAPSWATPEKQAAYRSALASGLSNLLGTGDSKADDIANANAIYQKIIAADEGMGGGRDLTKMAQTFAAVSGKGAYENMGNAGSLNQFTGEQSINPIGQSIIAENNAQAGNAGSAAALNRARLPLIQAQVELTKNKMGQEIKNPDGSVTVVYPGKPLTESQAKASAFLGQMKSADDLLDRVPKDQSQFGTQLDISMARTLGNPMASAKAQQIRQAQEQWAEAFLRFKSGAAVTEKEVSRNIQTFFPQIGDTPDVIEQKRIMREQAKNDMAIAAGQGAAMVKSVYSGRSNEAKIAGGVVNVDVGMLERLVSSGDVNSIRKLVSDWRANGATDDEISTLLQSVGAE